MNFFGDRSTFLDIGVPICIKFQNHEYGMLDYKSFTPTSFIKIDKLTFIGMYLQFIFGIKLSNISKNIYH